MELYASYKVHRYIVEIYAPELGKEDVWTLWVVEDGRVIHETSIHIEPRLAPIPSTRSVFETIARRALESFAASFNGGSCGSGYPTASQEMYAHHHDPDLDI